MTQHIHNIYFGYMKTMLNIKTEVSLKKKAQKVAKELGLSLSVVMNNYLRDFIETEKVVFQKPLIPNTSTKKILDKALEDIKKGRNIEGHFENADDMIKALNK